MPSSTSLTKAERLNPKWTSRSLRLKAGGSLLESRVRSRDAQPAQKVTITHGARSRSATQCAGEWRRELRLPRLLLDPRPRALHERENHATWKKGRLSAIVTHLWEDLREKGDREVASFLPWNQNDLSHWCHSSPIRYAHFFFGEVSQGVERGAHRHSPHAVVSPVVGLIPFPSAEVEARGGRGVSFLQKMC